MSKFLYPIYKLKKTKSYIKWWLYHKKAGGSGVLSEILQGFSFNLENTLNRKFKLFEIEGNSVQDGSPSPDNEVPILSSGDNGSINEKIKNADGTEEQDYSIFVQQPFRSKGDVRDLFFKNTVDSPYYDENLTLNGWYERHYFNLTDLGDYNWSPVNQNENSRTQGLFMSWSLKNIENYSSSATTIPKLLSNKYISKPNYKYQSYGRNPQNYTISTYGGEILYIQNSDFSGYTNEQVKEAMAGTLLQYPIETPLDLPCTEEQIQQLENLPSTYKDFTIINSEDETPAHLKIQYYKEG